MDKWIEISARGKMSACARHVQPEEDSYYFLLFLLPFRNSIKLIKVENLSKFYRHRQGRQFFYRDTIVSHLERQEVKTVKGFTAPLKFPRVSVDFGFCLCFALVFFRRSILTITNQMIIISRYFHS